MRYLYLCAVVSKVDWDAWLFSPGLPPEENHYDTSLAVAADTLAVLWHTADVIGIGGAGPDTAAEGDLEGWPSAQVGG
jgi:leukotriene-A4 hydrolase